MTQTISKETQRTLNAVVTPERQRRSEWTLQQGAPRIRSAVKTLLNSEYIDQDAADAAERWLRSYNLGKNDYVEYPPNHTPNTTVRHDAVSWQMLRAVSWREVAFVRSHLGRQAHQLFELMLADEKSFGQIAEIVFPSLGLTTGITRSSAACAMVLSQLPGALKAYDRWVKNQSDAGEKGECWLSKEMAEK
ncbi:hypothetical protein [Komagataeibacter xylinus]|uniref:Uncharacterized protein n=1 Tax=Komagataeibacter xylinus TaxID=28448 RepID=A0A857FJ08_KOMXY|nr:hypothetical protein [Komagataeibacter xylinus]QHC34145.1 hypothetical protein FMA36_00210 [Komagataeibacter xylinus]